MNNRICKENILLLQTYYYPVRIDKLEDIINHRVELTSWPCIVVVSGGTGVLSFNNTQFTLSQGSIIFWNNAEDLHASALSYAKLQGILIQYRCFSNDGTEPSLFQHAKPMLAGSYRSINLAIELERMSRASFKSSPFRFQKKFLELLEVLYNDLYSRHQQSESWMEQTLDTINGHFHEELTREQMAQQAQVSPEHFSRTFHKYTGYTFSAYLTLLRIRESQQKLLYHMPKLDDLAQEVGYKEGTYLSRKFKQLVGISPTAYYHKQKRIITLNTNHTACLLTLGITPELGVYSPWLEGIKQVNSMYKLKGFEQDVATNYQNIMAACPDVIINYSGHKDLLSLAPVVELPYLTMSWREQFHLIANIVDRQEQAEQWFRCYDQFVSICNEQLDQQLGMRGSAIVWEIGAHAAYCIDSSHGRGSQILYEDLKFQRPPSILRANIEKKGYIEKDVVAIPDYPADHIFITALPTDHIARKRVNQLFQSEAWQRMEAVRQNRVYVMNSSHKFYGYDPLSTKAQLFDLMHVLTS